MVKYICQSWLHSKLSRVFLNPGDRLGDAALVDARSVSGRHIVLGDEVLLPGQHIGTDPTIYFPLIKVVVLAF